MSGRQDERICYNYERMTFTDVVALDEDRHFLFGAWFVLPKACHLLRRGLTSYEAACMSRLPERKVRRLLEKARPLRSRWTRTRFPYDHHRINGPDERLSHLVVGKRTYNRHVGTYGRSSGLDPVTFMFHRNTTSDPQLDRYRHLDVARGAQILRQEDVAPFRMDIAMVYGDYWSRLRNDSETRKILFTGLKTMFNEWTLGFNTYADAYGLLDDRETNEVMRVVASITDACERAVDEIENAFEEMDALIDEQVSNNTDGCDDEMALGFTIMALIDSFFTGDRIEIVPLTAGLWALTLPVRLLSEV